MKIAVFFPGIGYTCEKPLLYFSQKLCVEAGYEIVTVPYGGFESGIKGNLEKMKAAFAHALAQAEEILANVAWDSYDEILFVSKSIGTIVAGAFAQKHELQVRNIYYTPMMHTFQFAGRDAIMFHGTSDPWALDTEEILAAARERNIPVYLVEQANHSLEVDDMAMNLKNLQWVMEISGQYIFQ